MTRQIFNSKLGVAFAVVYLIIAAFAIADFWQCQGGWINLCSLLLGVVILPSDATLGYLLTLIGMSPINYTELKFLDIAQIILHLLVCILLVYLIGCVIEKIIRKLFQK